MSENTWSVYRHTFPDGKVYIGKTKEAPEERWGTYGRNYQGQRKVFNAILAFGWNNIKHEVLFNNLSAEEASIKEQELIKLSDADGLVGNYNVQFAKPDPKEKKCVKGDDAVICAESLRNNGKFLIHMPDAYYDNAIAKHGVSPVGLTLEEDRVLIEVWREVPGGYEFVQNVAPYPSEDMTFRQVREWLAATGEIGEEFQKSFFEHGEIEEHIEKMKKNMESFVS